MDSPQPVSVPNRTRFTGIWLIIAAASLVVVFVAIVASRHPAPEPNFVWLDQSQFARQTRPGRLKTLYFKIVRITAPIWQRFRRPKTNILIDSKIMAVHGASTSDLGVGAAMATNKSGVQIWMLSPSELHDLRQRLKTAQGIDLVNAPRIVDVDGMTASIFVGQSLPHTSAPVGVTIDVTPKIAIHQLQLAINALYTEQNDSPTIPLRTNLSAAFRVRLSNAGGLLISTPISRDLNRTNYWLILESTAIDGRGKPINL
jgi:hypothetical protein